MSKSPSLRRIKADIRELSVDPSDQYHAAPLEHDMFEWHFTIRGAAGTDFAGGVYHGRILLPPEYPFKPPNIVFLTPSGRFETGVKVCLSFSAHHPELWQPAWGVRLILEALISFLPTPADGAIGALDWTPEERRRLAEASVKFRCPVCCAEGETCADLLPELKAGGDDGGAGSGSNSKTKTKFREEIEKLKMLQFQNHASNVGEGEGKGEGEEEGSDAKSDAAEGQIGADATEDDDRKRPAEVKADDAGAVAQKPAPTGGEAEVKSGEVKSEVVSDVMHPEPEGSNPISAEDATTADPGDAVPHPPASPANNDNGDGERARGRRVVPAPAAAPAAEVNNNNNAPMISDNLLNGMIGFFAVVVAYLLRQAGDLIEELYKIEGIDTDPNDIVDMLGDHLPIPKV